MRPSFPRDCPRVVSDFGSLVVLAVLLAGAGCGGDSTSTTPVSPPPVTASTLQLVSGGDQRARVTRELTQPVIVMARSSSGAAVSGATVSFSASNGDQVSPASAITDAGGLASTKWTFGATAGAHTLSASITALGSGSVAVNGVADSALAVVITVADGDRQNAVTGSAVVVPPMIVVRNVTATTQVGVPQAGVRVRFIVASGGGSVGSAIVTTDANGRASAGSWTLGAIGAQSLRPQLVDGDVVAASSSSFSATAVAAGGVVTTPVRSYTLSSSTATSVADSVTGFRFSFPQGARGVLDVARVVSASSEPTAGLVKFTAAFSGSEPAELAMAVGAGGEIAAYLYGDVYDAATSGPAGTRWWGLPVQRTRNDTAFILLQPARSASVRADNRGGAAYTSRTTAPKSSQPTIQAYGAIAIPAGSPGATVRAQFRAVTLQSIDWWLAQLPAADRARLQAALTAHPLFIQTGTTGDSYYWNSLFTGYQPTIYYNTTRDPQHVARHEPGHYISHMLLGDSRYSSLLEEAPGEGHDLGLVANGFRRSIIEEYPHASEFFMNGNLTNWDLRSLSAAANVRALFAPFTPATQDYPSLEAFGAVMLASLSRSGPDTLVYDFFSPGSRSRSPALAVPVSRLLAILAAGPLTPDALQQALQSEVGAHALAATLEPVGWSYNGLGRVVNANKQPIAGAEVASVIKVGGKEYRTTRSTPTGTDGRFFLPRLFPGTSTLRVFVPKGASGTDSTDIATYTVPWSTSTTVVQAFGDLTYLDLTGFTRFNLSVSGLTSPNTAGTDACRPNFFINNSLPIDGVQSKDYPLLWTGNAFSASGSTAYEILNYSERSRYNNSMSVTGTATAGRGDTVYVTLSGSSGAQAEQFVVAAGGAGAWVLKYNSPATIGLKEFPLVRSSGQPAAFRATLTGNAAAAVLNEFSYSYFDISPTLPTFHPQNCSRYTIDVSKLQIVLSLVTNP